MASPSRSTSSAPGVMLGDSRASLPAAERPRAVEKLLRSLLELTGVAETERRVLGAVRELTSARWVACFGEDDSRFVCHGSDGPGPAKGVALSCDPARLSGLAWDRGVLGTGEADLDLYPGGRLAALLSPADGVRTLLLLGPPERDEYGEAVVSALLQAVDCCALALQNAQLLDRLHSQVFVDFLTECYNRRGFEDHLRVEMVRARRYQRPLALMLLDLDNFKDVNDTAGHPAGDHVLHRVGLALRTAFRTTDVVCRYGGDEFAVIFPETPREEVVRLADRIRVQIEALFPDDSVSLGVTASVGVAALSGGSEGTGDAADLVRAADGALYSAKRSGRNRVAVASPA